MKQDEVRRIARPVTSPWHSLPTFTCAWQDQPVSVAGKQAAAGLLALRRLALYTPKRNRDISLVLADRIMPIVFAMHVTDCHPSGELSSQLGGVVATRNKISDVTSRVPRVVGT